MVLINFGHLGRSNFKTGGAMLDVDIEKIIPVIEAKEKFDAIVVEVESTDGLYVLTKNGKPCAVIVGVHHLEKLTGTSHEVLMGTAAGVAGATDDAVVESQPQEKVVSTAPIDNSAEVVAAATPAIDLTNFPTDDVSGNEPAPITPEVAAAPVPAEETAVSSGITNIAADPTLSTDPFDSSQAVTTTAPRFADGPATVAPAAEAASVAEEDPLDFLSSLDNQNSPAAEVAAAPADASSAATTVPVTAAAQAGNPDFLEDSGGANSSNTPDDIVTPVQGAYAQAEDANQPTQPQQPIQQ